MKLYQTVLDRMTPFQELTAAVDSGRLPCMLVGLSSIHKAHFIYALSEHLDAVGRRPVLVLTEDEQSARRMCADVNEMYGEEKALFYPMKDITFRNIESVSGDYEQIRLGVLSRISTGSCRLVFASAAAALQYTIPPAEMSARSVTWRGGDTLPMEEAVKTLIRAGYIRRPQVDGVSQFSVRGGLLDFFPPGAPAPLRLEFWGDEIDSIAQFELDSQRRGQIVSEVQITPAAEILFDSPEILANALEKLLDSLPEGKAGAPAQKTLEEDQKRLLSGVSLNNLDKYISLAYPKPATLFDYLDHALCIVSEWSAVRENAKAYTAQLHEDIKILLEEGELCGALTDFSLSFGSFHSQLESRGAVYMETFARSSSDLKLKSLISVNTLQNSVWGGDIKLLQEDLRTLIDTGYAVSVLAGTTKAASVLADDLRKQGFPADYVKDTADPLPGKVYVLAGTLSAGFEYPEIRFALLTHSGISTGRLKSSKKRKGEEIRSLSELNVGDLVVHVSHGIGTFDGIHKLELQGVVKDYIKIKYAGADTLYVPVTQLDLVSRYIGPKDNGTVKLNKLNSGEWQKTRSRVKKAVADMADELIRLYAEREQTKGFAFSPDNEWQREFEEHFAYEETEDQLRCVEEIKRDMCSERPMERLLCGDVGFGKTEVALRAAFKCVLDSKQCAILCPTTILAWQHYQTVTNRIGNFPVNVELLSRFRSPKEQKETLKRLKRGEVDIIIGTHRLLQKDVEFRDLGLAIIDEEQRFGVAHKEKFKEMFKGVDVLTLSATPIPRTLNMALSGIRDMSVIEQPPQDRYPVQTYVIEHDPHILGAALRRELQRDGQVYYIHNRIETIDSCAANIHALVPDARIGVAHGQMGEEQLSDVWRQLMEHEIDILVCTTIIETGVDVPNCNTLIIEDADRMGLSQLYQLRGRVGRSNRRAFAYFTFRRGKVLTEIAAKRLSAIREFTKFGSGFRIAMRDLEIRGAGSILGARQHGHMEAVGYDMYIRLLSEAVSERRGEPIDRRAEECLIDLQMDAHIPENYIQNLAQRIDVYRKIAAIRTEADSMDVLDELIDRFGDPPKSVQGLVDVALLRNMAGSFGFKEIGQKGETVFFYPEKIDMQVVSSLVGGMKGRVLVNAASKPYIAVKMKAPGTTIETIRETLDILKNTMSKSDTTI